MPEFLLAAENTPFTVALALMFGIAVLEGLLTFLGFGLSSTLDALIPDFDVDFEPPAIGSEIEPGFSAELDSPSALSRLLGWLRIGKVPALMLLVIFLTGFGLSGLALQSLVQGATGSLLPGILMSIPAVLMALPVVRIFGGILDKVMPKDETDAVTEDSLVGRVATITLGTAKTGSPAEAKVRDLHGTTHYVMVEPDIANAEFTAGSSVLLVKRQSAVFKVIDNPNPALVDEQN